MYRSMPKCQETLDSAVIKQGLGVMKNALHSDEENRSSDKYCGASYRAANVVAKKRIHKAVVRSV